MVIGHIASHGMDSGLKSMQAALSISVLGIFNALTRVVMGLVVDKVGAKLSFLTIFIAQVVAILVLYPAGSSALLLVVVAALIGWNYGAMFTLFPALCLQYFGSASQGANYGLLFSAFGLAGLFGPYIGGILKDTTGTYYVPFIVAAVMLVVSVVLSWIGKPPSRKIIFTHESL